MANTETNNTDLARAEDLRKSADAFRAQIDANRGIEGNFGSPSRLTHDGRRLSSDAEKSEPTQWR